jgi:hypothetical protein
LFFIFISCGEKSSFEDKFKSDIIEYLDAYNKTDWDKVTSMIYPPFFSAVSKNQIIQTLRALDSMGLKRRFNFKGINKISDIVANGNERYCRIYYNAVITIVINQLQLPNIEKFKEDFDEDFGKENVKFNPALNQFTINAGQSVIAAADKDLQNWKYIELNNEHAIDRILLIIPKEIFKRLEE